MKFWQTSTVKNAVMGAAVVCLGYAIADLADMAWDFVPPVAMYVSAWLTATVTVLNRARQGDVSGFPTFGP